MILYLTNQKNHLFAGYSYGYTLDPYVVLYLTREASGGDGFSVEPFRDGSSGNQTIAE
jgi:hypothetical protein